MCSKEKKMVVIYFMVLLAARVLALEHDPISTDPEFEQLKAKIEQINKYMKFVKNIDINEFYDMDEDNLDLSRLLDEVTPLLTNPDNVKEIMKSDELLETINKVFTVYDIKALTKVLNLIKALLTTMPDLVKYKLPDSMVDQILLNIRENNVAVKALCLDILNLWLPGNPEVQEKIMKKKGLDIIYDQIHKLDAIGIKSILELFDTIIKEHLKENDISRHRNEKDIERYRKYQKVGLIEMLSSQKVCFGLLQIFKNYWSYSNNKNTIFKPMFDLLRSVKPFCVHRFHLLPQAQELFNDLLQNLQDTSRLGYFENHDFNLKKAIDIVEEYVYKKDRNEL